MVISDEVGVLRLQEIFVPIKLGGYKYLHEKYSISNYGNIYDKVNYRFIKQSLCGSPTYKYVTLTHKSERSTFRVHRLVALCFIENCTTNNTVDHIDRDRYNNYAGNLRWVSRSENQINSDRIENATKVYDNTYNKKIFYKDLKGVDEHKRVWFKNKYYGIAEDYYTAAKVYDVIASTYNKVLQLNFPDEGILCHISEINKHLKNLPDEKSIYTDTINRIKYLWEHEYISKTSLSKKFRLSFEQLNFILNDVKKKDIKPKFKFVDVEKIYKRHYLNGLILQKYLSGCYSRKKILSDLKYLGATKKIINNSIYGLSLGRSKPLPDEVKREIYSEYICGMNFMDCVRKYNITKSIMRNIKNKFKDT